MCFFSRLFGCGCNNCSRNRRSSFNQNVRMNCVDAGGRESCECENDRRSDGSDCGCHSHHHHNSCCE